MTLELTTVKSLRAAIAGWKAAGDSIALVPTMGALHRGHMALVEAARAKAKRVMVSIFVNPTQFGINEDFDRYPRPREHDLFMLREEGVDAAWLPTVEEMYPAGFATNVRVSSISEGLEGASRPGHFDGVATVVSKLLLQTAPDMAFFGEKDYQQLCVIRRLVADLNIPVEIIGMPTVREASGLALSSRNQYLSDDERDVASMLYATLHDLAARLKSSPFVIPAQGQDDSVELLLANAKNQLLAAGFSKIDYLALCDADHLQPLYNYQLNARLLISAWLGKTRLIDNIAVG